MSVNQVDAALSWEADAKGEVYCAPACGRGCTTKEHDIAVASAELLARTLGPDWTTDVWENLGWHYAVRSFCGRLTVHPGSANSFIAFLGEPGTLGGRWAEHGDTPQEAINATVAVAAAEYKEIGALIEGLE
ncbi:hypothetical protein LCGC14_2428890 [marine sediment metagenome]|uniref:Uncharacterized protein n=1 Tax=marine sediment metagenome TaxID=412755 RepID=A0A0F9EGH8_9ZZZZ